MGSRACRNTPDHEGCADGATWTQAAVGRGGPSTGPCWRTGSAPSRRAALSGSDARPAKGGHSSRFLSLLDRQRIASLHRAGCGVREIARRLGRAPSMISRELRRNTARHDRCYDGDLAHARARQRARRPRRSRIGRDPRLREIVRKLLEDEWSPEQIAAHLRSAYPDQPSWHVCHEIYQALYHGGEDGLSRTLTAKLRTGRPLRRHRRRADVRQPRFVVPAQLIDHRPAEVEDRSRIGHWEGALIVGRMSQSAIGTLVERRSRLVRLVHLPDGHSAFRCRAAIEQVMASVPASARLTLTWDQGSEMAEHHLLAVMFGEGIYSAPPASPWLRGTNENTNGLLRQYFQKKADLRAYTVDDLLRVEHRLNRRPRKVLGWRTPAEVFAADLVAP
ncbi:IS30 family transposase [Pseudonocardia sp.]|uniref:IS30 family transposase n=1 Tax=Pseudonocardia sp. TaxID=60912 RepID=UPI0025F50DDE|nr:IS30 family transposase [Pseudonocardia sp.]